MTEQQIYDKINPLDMKSSAKEISNGFKQHRLWTWFYSLLFIAGCIFIICVQTNTIHRLESNKCENNEDSLLQIGIRLAIDSVNQFYDTPYCKDSTHNYWVAHRSELNEFILPIQSDNTGTKSSKSGKRNAKR